MHQDGDGFDIMLQALPINGKIVLRPPRAQSEEPDEPARDNGNDKRRPETRRDK